MVRPTELLSFIGRGGGTDGAGMGFIAAEVAAAPELGPGLSRALMSKRADLLLLPHDLCGDEVWGFDMASKISSMAPASFPACPVPKEPGLRVEGLDGLTFGAVEGFLEPLMALSRSRLNSALNDGLLREGGVGSLSRPPDGADCSLWCECDVAKDLDGI